MTRHFCTYFDARYLSRGLALYESLLRHAQPFTLYALCLDVETAHTLTTMGVRHVVVVPIGDLEKADPELREARANRTRVEYYFTVTPVLPLYLFSRFPRIDLLTYLDADLYFFENPAAVLQEMSASSVMVVGHRFPEAMRHLAETFGCYNVGLIAFRNDDRAHGCLQWWRARCLERCSAQPVNGGFADQKYLDEWPRRFDGVHVAQHPGAGVAPWNLEGLNITEADGRILVEGCPLVFYHFHDLRMTTAISFEVDNSGFGVSKRSAAVKRIYRPYLGELQAQHRRLRGVRGAARSPRDVGRWSDRVRWLINAKHWVVAGPLWHEVKLR